MPNSVDRREITLPSWMENYYKRTDGEVVVAWQDTHHFGPTELVQKSGPPITKQYLSGLTTGRIMRAGKEHLIALSLGLEISPEILFLRLLPGEQTPLGLTTIPAKTEGQAKATQTLDFARGDNTGQVLRAWRKWHGWRLQDLADLVGPPINKGLLSSLETGRLIHSKHLRSIAMQLGLTLDEVELLKKMPPQLSPDPSSSH